MKEYTSQNSEKLGELKMDAKVKKAIDEHEDFQRLKAMFSLDFLVGCFTNSNRGPQARFIGNLLKQHGENPSLFISGMLYHEFVELEESRNMGYSDAQLAASNADDSNYSRLHLLSKRKELGFHQSIGKQVLEDNPELPFLSLVISSVAPSMDYRIPMPPYGPFCDMIKTRTAEGMHEYGDPFTLKHVQAGIHLFDLGGDNCNGSNQALSLARDYLAGKEPPRRPSIIELL